MHDLQKRPVLIFTPMVAKNPVQRLLAGVHDCLHAHKKHLQQSGEHFNVYEILELSTREVRLHSRLLAELLRPTGSHYMKDLFLKEFIGMLRDHGKDISGQLSSFDCGSASVYVEEPVGPIHPESDRGSRIDVLIRDAAGRVIVIENKIYAFDQDLQLERYSRIPHLAALLYLTPDGGRPQPHAVGSLRAGVDFACVSYEQDILHWLRTCLTNHQDLSQPVRWGIQPYIWVLEKITQQSSTHTMNNDIVSQMLTSDDSIASAFAIADHLQSLKDRRGEAIFRSLVKEIEAHHLDCVINTDYSVAFPFFEIIPNGWKNHLIALTVEGGLFLGIKRRSDVNPVILNSQIASMLGGFRESPYWLCYWVYKDALYRLDSSEVWQLKNEPLIVGELISKIKGFIATAQATPHLRW